MPAGADRASGGSGVSLEIQGLGQFLKELKQLDPALAKSWRTRVRKVVDDVAKDARRRAPKKRGTLQKGIRPSVTQKGASLLSKAPHARIFEFGGRHPVYGNRNNWVNQPAKPHIFPAVNAGRPNVEKEALAAFDDAASEIGFK